MKLIKIMPPVLLILLTYLLPVSTPPRAAYANPPQWMQPFQAEYTAKAKNLPIKGKVIRQLELQDNGSALFTSSIKVLFNKIEESTRFDWQGCQSKPQAYQYQRKTFTRDQTYAQTFDYAKGIVDYATEGKTTQSIALNDHPPLTDALSEQLMIRCKVKSGETHFTLHVLSKDQVRERVYQVTQSQEWLDLPIGRTQTIRVERIRENSTRETALWLAPSMDYLTVQVLQINDDGEYKIELSEFTTTSKTKAD